MAQSIMLVDDDQNLRALMKHILTRAGYTVHEVEDGNAALALLETSLPDLFIIDVMMPGMTGFELCQHLRANPQTQSRPFFCSPRALTRPVLRKVWRVERIDI